MIRDDTDTKLTSGTASGQHPPLDAPVGKEGAHIVAYGVGTATLFTHDFFLVISGRLPEISEFVC